MDSALYPGARLDPRLQKYEDTLRQVPVFEQMDTPFLNSLVGEMEIWHCTPGDVLVELGTLGTDVFIVHSGAVSVLDAQERPLCDDLLGPGSHFGESFFLES